MIPVPMLLDGTSEGPAWIVCHGEGRRVLGGSVRCGVRDRIVPVEDCLACRSLEDADGDRGSANACRTDSVAFAISATDEATDIALIIELI